MGGAVLEQGAGDEGEEEAKAVTPAYDRVLVKREISERKQHLVQQLHFAIAVENKNKPARNEQMQDLHENRIVREPRDSEEQQMPQSGVALVFHVGEQFRERMRVPRHEPGLMLVPPHLVMPQAERRNREKNCRYHEGFKQWPDLQGRLHFRSRCGFCSILLRGRHTSCFLPAGVQRKEPTAKVASIVLCRAFSVEATSFGLFPARRASEAAQLPRCNRESRARATGFLGEYLPCLVPQDLVNP